MKALITLLSASAILSTFAFAEPVKTTQQSMEQERVQTQNEIQNRFRNMSTDDLLKKRGTMTQQREREQLHNELQSRYQTMTQEQKRKFDQHPPENRTLKMKNQGGGMGSGMGGGGMGGGGGR